MLPHVLDILSRTLYGEAEANNEDDAKAIACVILNRAAASQWPNDVVEVCLQPWQFSCWNANDPGRERVAKANGTWFERCKYIAREALSGHLHDVTNGSTHYYATYIKAPKWAKAKTPTYTVQHRRGSKHLFFNNIDTPAPVTAKQALDRARPLNTTTTVKAAQIGVLGAGGVGAAAEMVDRFAPALSTIQMLALYAPWAIVLLLLGVVGYLVWKRIDDRNKGLR